MATPTVFGRKYWGGEGNWLLLPLSLQLLLGKVCFSWGGGAVSTVSYMVLSWKQGNTGGRVPIDHISNENAHTARSRSRSCGVSGIIITSPPES